MDYELGITGCYAGGIEQTHVGSYKGLHSEKLKQDLLITLLEYPELTQQLGFLTEQNTLTDKALKELLIGLTVDREQCFGNTPQWKLNWYD